MNHFDCSEPLFLGICEGMPVSDRPKRKRVIAKSLGTHDDFLRNLNSSQSARASSREVVGDISDFLHKLSVKHNIERQISSDSNRKRLREELNYGTGGGVLIAISYYWRPTFIHDVFQNINVYIDKWAPSSDYAYIRYRNTQFIYAAPPGNGWQRTTQFLWVEHENFDIPGSARSFNGVNTDVCLVKYRKTGNGIEYYIEGLD
jgi:hypothetical protein